MAGLEWLGETRSGRRAALTDTGSSDRPERPDLRRPQAATSRCLLRYNHIERKQNQEMVLETLADPFLLQAPPGHI